MREAIINMADTGILTQSGAVLTKAGAGANTTLTGDSDVTNSLIAQAEGYINAMTRYNWNDNYAALNTDVKSVLEEAASNLAAVYLINYDTSGYTSRGEAELMINVLLFRANQNIEVLKDKKGETFVLGA